jgi:6-pyruvoyltetrahydropterin/6-carboxytetrahydropterin synthase
MNTTAENMVVWMFEQIRDALITEGLYPNIQLEEVRLWETPTSFATMTRALMEE